LILYQQRCETGQVTIKGKTNEITMPFTFNENNKTGIFVGRMPVNRLDFGVGAASVVMSKDVVVKITANVVKE
jgi:polyisoprenoid-binding protein YceI